MAKSGGRKRRPQGCSLRSHRLRRLKPLTPTLSPATHSAMPMLPCCTSDLKRRPELFSPEDPVDLFAEYLERCTPGSVDEDERNELLADLVEVLSELKVDSNGGDREAREKIQAIYDLLDNAIEGHSMHPIDMLMTGKIFTDAGWAVPDSLRRAMAEALQAAPPDTQAVGENSIISALLEVADQAGQNPFDVHEHVNSLLAGFPVEASVMLLLALVAGKKPVIDQAVVGFVLHADAVLAQSVAEALAASATKSPR